MKANRYLVSVLIPDRVGILRDITTALTDLGANIDGISQTVLEGFFTVILTTTFADPCEAETVRRAVAGRFADDHAVLSVRPISASHDTRPTVAGERFIVTIAGEDRPGILKAVMTCLAAYGVNVEDWDVVREGRSITYIGEITVPAAASIETLQSGLQAAVAPFALAAGIQHENIFRATNEVGAISRLLDRGA
ncbi:MAG: ACT domain-containing protein [Lentisphaerae bacterium]|nr:ACT domain-containing protein [Lentisphaerota bacterium]